MEALKQTHLTDSMLKEADESPEMLSKLAQFASDYTATGQKVPSARKFGYTVFVERMMSLRTFTIRKYGKTGIYRRPRF